MGREHRSIAKRRFKSWQVARKGLVDHLDLDSLDTAKGAEQLAARINDIFDKFDVDRSAGIDASEMVDGMKSIGINLTPAQARSLLKEADADVVLADIVEAALDVGVVVLEDYKLGSPWD